MQPKKFPRNEVAKMRALQYDLETALYSVT